MKCATINNPIIPHSSISLLKQDFKENSLLNILLRKQVRKLIKNKNKCKEVHAHNNFIYLIR